MQLGFCIVLAVAYRPAAVAQIPPLAWEPPYAAGVALKRSKRKKEKKGKKKTVFKALACCGPLFLAKQ